MMGNCLCVQELLDCYVPGFFGGVLCYLYTASDSDMIPSLKQAQVQGLYRNKPELEGVDSSFYLPISLWILLHYWQTDSLALWADRSPLSAGYHFQLNPFI